MRNILYISDRSIHGTYAHMIARISMAQGFASNDDIKKVFFFFASSKKTNKKIKALNHKKIRLMEIYCPFYTEGSQSFIWRIIIRYLCNAPVVTITLLIKILSHKYDGKEIIFIRGEKAMMATYIGTFLLRKNFGCEIHNYEFGKNKFRDFFYRLWMKRAKLIITISGYTKSNWVKHGIVECKIQVLPSGVDIEKFDKANMSVSSLRDTLKMPQDKKIAMYCGQLLAWKGIDILFESWVNNKNPNNLLYIVGGSELDIKKYKLYTKKRNVKNIIFLGYKDTDLIPLYMKAADVLILPNTAKNVISCLHTSPIKLFEYMASKIPIIAADLPSIRQFVTKKEVIFFRPDNSTDLWSKIDEVFSHHNDIKQKVVNAYKKVQGYTWKKRSDKIYNLLKK